MTLLDIFPSRSRLQCCGVCERWSVRRIKRQSITFCPVLSRPLPDDLTACGCSFWHKEPRGSFALELFAELEKELRT